MSEDISAWKIEEVHPILTVKSKRLLNGKLTYIVIKQEIIGQSQGVILEPDALPKLIEILTSLANESTKKEQP